MAIQQAQQQNAKIATAQAILNHTFNDVNLIAEALQAAGALVPLPNKQIVPDGNKRLAMIGDTILKLALLENWWPSGNPKATGEYILQREANNGRLVEICTNPLHDLSACITRNPSQQGQQTLGAITLSATVEAVLGALYFDMDRNIERVKPIMRALGFPV